VLRAVVAGRHWVAGEAVRVEKTTVFGALNLRGLYRCVTAMLSLWSVNFFPLKVPFGATIGIWLSAAQPLSICADAYDCALRSRDSEAPLGRCGYPRGASFALDRHVRDKRGTEARKCENNRKKPEPASTIKQHEADDPERSSSTKPTHSLAIESSTVTTNALVPILSLRRLVSTDARFIPSIVSPARGVHDTSSDRLGRRRPKWYAKSVVEALPTSAISPVDSRTFDVAEKQQRLCSGILATA
jgi:hypothetical protein